MHEIRTFLSPPHCAALTRFDKTLACLERGAPMPLQRDNWGAASLLTGPHAMSATVVPGAAPAFDLAIPAAACTVASHWVRPRPRGKFLWVGEEKLYVRGVTYGTF